MAFCSNCGSELPEGAKACPGCGAVLVEEKVDIYDHTSEFDVQDISDNKVVALSIYAFDVLGLFLGAILAKDSPYAKFHLREALKIEIVSFIAAIAAVVLCWTIIVPIAAAIFCVILFVVKIIAFVQVCKGEAKNPWLVRSFTFLS